jgi:uncharacterized protein (TIGR02266 family)
VSVGHDNRRRHNRTEVLLKVAYQDSADLLNDYITNLGAGGMCVHTDLPLAPGQSIAFALSFPGLLEPLQLSGVVRWRRAGGEEPGDDASVGVEFVFPDEAVRQRLLALLDEIHRRTEQPPEPVAEAFRVLLVEDNEFVQQMFQYAVHRFHAERGGEGIEVYCAATGTEALSLIREQTIDLAIVDHFLPGVTGCELVRHLRADPRTAQIPVLVISVGGDEVRRLAAKCGADLFLDKPVVHKQLVRTIETLVARRQRSE